MGKEVKSNPCSARKGRDKDGRVKHGSRKSTKPAAAARNRGGGSLSRGSGDPQGQHTMPVGAAKVDLGQS